MTRRISHLSILLALGLVLNLSVQFFAISGMKVDFVVVMLCISLLNAESLQEALIAGIAYGILTALTTTFPFGQVANLIDKLIVSVVLFYAKNFFKISLKDKTKLLTYGIVGTILSGSIFLFIALLIGNSLNMFSLLFATVVIPSAIGNSIVIILLSKVFLRLQKA